MQVTAGDSTRAPGIRMRSLNWKTVSTLATMWVVAGCQENSVVSPVASTTVAPASALLAPSDRPSLSLNGDGGKNSSGDFTVGAWGGVYFAGNHAVIFPAHSICDPATSSYGPGTWDSPCNALRTPLNVHVEVTTDKNGVSSVDFTPSLRFVPTHNPKRWVWLYMYTPEAKGATGDLSKFNILYATNPGAVGIDETGDDASLRTYVDTYSGITSRRIKHFSGYVNLSGRSCDPAVEQDCVAVPDPIGIR